MRNFVVSYKLVVKGEVIVAALNERDAKRKALELPNEQFQDNIKQFDCKNVEVTDARVLDQED
jgi:hypothetical protein